MRTLDVVGDPWALQIIKEAFLGVRRFQDFQSRLGITRQTLILRLNRFTEEALMYKAPVQDGRLVHEYRLTPKGADLYSFIIMVWRWHSHWHADASILPARLYHSNCGKLLQPEMCCHACQGEIAIEDVTFRSINKAAAVAGSNGRRPRIVNKLEDLGSDYLATVVIGDGWSIQILTVIMRGVYNYDAIRKVLGISSNVLSARLKTLLSLDLLQVQGDDRDGRLVSYHLTEKGRGIFPMILALMQWGDHWMAGSTGPADLLLHDGCGHILEHRVQCAHCRERLRLEDVSFTSPP
ncbi:transcriptional regulator [Seongchinamella sediminis]|uniref:Transcriptional regulator n=1 Tax=Seongchinamella sediminis TaxID=2283635 RepID=A0A3L7DTS7_9GAMM|nr:winged helix-turn-helix transcriptional regulator [Seongchinamella sediminis]RLQ20175.1 transcriptional regulator [Seongchinamella sediminis]